MRTWIAITAALALGACGGQTSQEAETPAITAAEPAAPAQMPVDTVIYTAASIITMDADNPRAEAVAVRDGEIVGVGTREDLESEFGGRAETDTRFASHIITPGLIDQHVHPWLAALTSTAQVIAIEDWDTANGYSAGVRTEAEYRQRLEAAIAAHNPADGLFFSWGYHQYFHGEMDRAYLDTLATDFPIILWHRSIHEFYLNTTALETYGIDPDWLATWTEYQRSQMDFERGHFFETAGEKLLERIGGDFMSPARLGTGFAFTRDYLHAAGVTTIAEPGGLLIEDLQRATNAVFGAPDAPLNSYFIPDGKTLAQLYLGDGAETLIGATAAITQWGEGRAQYLPGQVKLFADGAMYSQLMQMRDGYLDGHDGEWIMYPDAMDAAFQIYWDAGYQMHIHQNGTAGLDMVIASLEAAQTRAPRDDHRTVIVHYGFAAPDQIEQLASLGAIVSANPYYVVALGERYAHFGIGEDRVDTMMVPLRSTVDAGISLSLHSDMAMAPARPLFLMEAAITRQTVEGPVRGPQERLTVDQALRAVTIDAAYSVQLEDEIGSIEIGKQADFTILDSDPYVVEPDQIAEIGIWGTVLGGRLQPLDAD